MLEDGKILEDLRREINYLVEDRLKELVKDDTLSQQEKLITLQTWRVDLTS